MTTTSGISKCRIVDKDDNNLVLANLHKRKGDGLFTGRIVVPIHNLKATIVIRTAVGEKTFSVQSMKKEAVGLWHNKLGNTNILTVTDTIAAGKYGMNSSSEKSQVCDICVETKNRNVAYKRYLVERSRAITADAVLCRLIKRQRFERSKCLV